MAKLDGAFTIDAGALDTGPIQVIPMIWKTVLAAFNLLIQPRAQGWCVGARERFTSCSIIDTATSAAACTAKVASWRIRRKQAEVRTADHSWHSKGSTSIIKMFFLFVRTLYIIKNQVVSNVFSSFAKGDVVEF